MKLSRLAGVSLFCICWCFPPYLLAQHRVDQRNRYERLISVVKLTGKGTVEDPVRPMYAPLPGQNNPVSRSSILGYHYVTSDDGKYALVEYVAADRAAFSPILADKSLKCFVKGNDKKPDIEVELKKYKKDFDFDSFAGTVVGQ